MQKHTPYHLLHKKLTGEISEAESNLLDKLMDTDSEISIFEEDINHIWEKSSSYNSNVVFNADAAFSKFQDRIQNEKVDTNQQSEEVQTSRQNETVQRKIENEGQPAKVMRMKPNRSLLPLAASFLVVIASIFLIRNSLTNPTITESKANTYVLEDGSKIWLNDDSEFSYSKKFSSDRTINLSGEAYFEVNPASKEPFVVKTENSTIEVIGTEFNVNATPNSIEVGVIEGSVELTHNSQSMLVKEGKKAFNAEDGSIETVDLVTRNISNWRKAGLSFKSDNLATVISDLQIYFDGVKIIADNNAVDLKCNNISSPNVPHNSTIETIFDILNATHSIEYKKNADGSYTILKFNCSK